MWKVKVIIFLPYLIIKHYSLIAERGYRTFYKSVKFNFRIFDYSTASILPVYIGKNSIIKALKGKIILPEKKYSGIVQFGIFEIAIFDSETNRNIIDIKDNSTIYFEGKANFGVGSKITLNPDSKLVIGENFVATATLTIICSKNIVIRKDCLFSWDIQIMDTDFHTIIPENKVNNGITIGEKNWIGCKVCILKNTETQYNTIVGACSLLNKQYAETNCIIAGNPAKIIKNNTNWK